MTTTVFAHMNLFDGRSDVLSEDSWMVIDDEIGTITGLGAGEPPQADSSVDLEGKYVMPGLMNAHTHMWMNPDSNALENLSETEVTVNSLANLKTLLRSGVTYIRDCGCPFSTDVKLAKLQRAGIVEGPGIVASGRPMTMTGGHGDFVEGIDGETKVHWGHLVDSEDEMRRAVRTEFKIGAKNIKTMVTGGVMSSTDQVDDIELTLGQMKVAVHEAHTKHMTVASHAQGRDGIQLALDAGVDSIEHGIYIDEEQARYMKEHNVFLVPTLNATYSIATYGKGKLPDYMMRKNEVVMRDFYANIAMAIKAGVKVVVGTDAGTPFNSFESGTYDEIALMVKLGATPVQALFAATKYAAELLHVEQDHGSLGVGTYGDFLVLDRNPLEDVFAVRQHDKQVFKKGVPVM